jgi:glycosyltransferase involved in cell wall biosynthesis
VEKLPNEQKPAAAAEVSSRALAASVVVPTASQRPEQLSACLESLGNLDPGEHEALVVDNGPGDEITREIAAGAGARYLHEPMPSASRARTVGARASRGRIVVFTDDDAIAQPGWLAAHIDAFSDPSVAATTGRILPLADPGDDARQWVDTAGDDLGEEPISLDRSVDDWFERANFGGLGIGPNMAFRKQLFEHGWCFHEDLGPPLTMLGEEPFAFFELIDAGWRITYVPEARVNHRAIVTADDVESYRRILIRGVSPYVLFLLSQARGYRRETLRYVSETARGKRRQWRPGHTIPRPTSRKRMLLESGTAPLSYLQARFSRRPRLPRSAPPPGPLLSSVAARDGRPSPRSSAPS